MFVQQSNTVSALVVLAIGGFFSALALVASCACAAEAVLDAVGRG